MEESELRRLTDTDFPDMGPITDESRLKTIKYARTRGGNVRQARGLFYTDKEYEMHRKKVLEKPIPGESFLERVYYTVRHALCHMLD